MTQSLTWHDVIGAEKQQDYFQQTLAFVEQQRQAGKVIFPPAKDVFNAFRFTEFNQVKVVILGQDPYHGPNQAHGLCFSVQPGIKTPLRWSTCIRNWHRIFLAFRSRTMAISKAGPSRAFCFSTPY